MFPSWVQWWIHGSFFRPCACLTHPVSPTEPSLANTGTHSTVEERRNVLGSAKHCKVMVNRLEIPLRPPTPATLPIVGRRVERRVKSKRKGEEKRKGKGKRKGDKVPLALSHGCTECFFCRRPHLCDFYAVWILIEDSELLLLKTFQEF